MTIVVETTSTATTIIGTSQYDWIMPDLPMAPLALVLNAIRDSVIELCERALIWRQELQQIRVLGTTSTTTTAAAADGDTSITVASITNFSDGDTITVLLSDDSEWRGHVSGTPSGSTITLDGALNNSVDSGAAVTKLVYLYTMTYPANTTLAKILTAWLNDNVIEPIPEDDLTTEFNNTDFGWVGSNWRTDIGLPTRYYVQNDTTIGLALAPNAAGNLRISAALKPTREATTFPGWITQRYMEVIAHGAKWRVLRIPSKPYSNATLAAYYERKWEDGIADARIRAARSATRAPLRTHSVYMLR